MIIDAWAQHATTRHLGDPMFGSNFPMITPANALEDLDDLRLDEETAGLFLGGNAERVFGLSS
jgi:predicted TIM-barrel fold metal-dependent hydrolase